MIKYNKKDKLLSSIVDELNSSVLVKSIKSARDLYIYGISQQRSVDIAVPDSFPNVGYLKSRISENFPVQYLSGVLWPLAEAYNYKVLGLGMKLRKNDKATCQKLILMHYLSLNEMLEVPQEHNEGHTISHNWAPAPPAIANNF